MMDSASRPSIERRAGLSSADVQAALHQAAELRAAGRAQEEATLLLTTLEAQRSAPGDGDLPGRVQLALRLADLYLDGGDPERSRRLLDAEAAVFDSGSRRAEAAGQSEQKRILARGSLALRDRAIQVALVGQPAPRFEVLAWILGQTWQFDELRGRVVLVEFWATWCRPCLGMFPKLQELYERYADRGLVVLALTRLYSPLPRPPESEAQELELIGKVVQDRGLEYSVGVLSDDRLQRAYGASGFPTVGLIDRRGIVRYARFGGTDGRVEELLERCLDE